MKLFFAKLTQLIRKIPHYLRKGLGAVWSFIKRHKIITFLLLLIIIVAILIANSLSKARQAMEQLQTPTYVERRDIEESIDGSAVLEPNDEYTIVPLVTGEIISAPFEEGDYVNKGDLMYQFDASSVENSIASADLAIANAKQNYEDALNAHTRASTSSSVQSARIALEKAQNSYDDAVQAREDLSVKSTISGTVQTIHVKEGDSVAAGTQIAEIYDDSYLSLKVPFNNTDADHISVGDSATVTLTNSGAALSGTVSEVSSSRQAAAGYMMVRYVTIDVPNPGAVMAGDTATAMVNNIACNDVGTFSNLSDTVVTAKASGTIEHLYVSEGDHISTDGVLATIDSDTVESQITSAQLSVEDAEQALNRAVLQELDDTTDSTIKSAQRSLEDAKLNKENLLEQLEDYTITAPISGTVVTKNKKQGDKYEGGSSMAAASSSSTSSSTSSSSSNALAVIYDMSSLKFDLSVDELDVKKVTVGQSVTITADASDKEYHGVVENVSVNGVVGTNGVTTYPVKVRLTDNDDQILPGMNIEAKIVLTSAENVLSVPASALNRGDIVYVKGDKTESSDSAPEGYRSVEVEVGASDGDYIEIISGLEEGQEIYVEQSSSTENPLMMGVSGGAPEGGAPGGGGGPGGGGAPGGGPGGGM